ncbi:hypothetical protein HK405_002526, partial [Cladochytrium tenue]
SQVSMLVVGRQVRTALATLSAFVRPPPPLTPMAPRPTMLPSPSPPRAAKSPASPAATPLASSSSAVADSSTATAPSSHSLAASNGHASPVPVVQRPPAAAALRAAALLLGLGAVAAGSVYLLARGLAAAAAKAVPAAAALPAYFHVALLVDLGLLLWAANLHGLRRAGVDLDALLVLPPAVVHAGADATAAGAGAGAAGVKNQDDDGHGKDADDEGDGDSDRAGGVRDGFGGGDASVAAPAARMYTLAGCATASTVVVYALFRFLADGLEWGEERAEVVVAIGYASVAAWLAVPFIFPGGTVGGFRVPTWLAAFTEERLSFG